MILRGLFFIITVFGAVAPLAVDLISGQVLDNATGKPLAGAFVTCGRQVVTSDARGHYIVPVADGTIKVRAPGYGRTEVERTGAQIIRLNPVTPKALYLSFYGIGSRKLRESALRLIETTELNALVIDVKGDRGLVAYRSSIPLAKAVGAQKTITIPDMKGLVDTLKERGIYTIARIVVFKDHPLAMARPEYAVKRAMGGVWRDRERLAWTDPFMKEVWEYNLDIAEEAARSGFDEIQFDYLRFPDAPGGLAFSRPSNQYSRIAAISGFLAAAQERLKPYNVFIAADIFGYVCWNRDDTHIGQRLENLISHADYLSPMLYPSGYHLGIPGYLNPVSHPFEIVSLSLKRAQKRTDQQPVRFRPWLQAFKDYAFDRRRFGGEEIHAQIKAAEEFGSNGWMLWNPRNVYSSVGLRKRP